ncbi:DnaJ-domain-containing protein [Gymnopus androsaceus JB14]|uniref:DnaJ-domain-containing protein n=1 Tax=Gymnopus androsaceus JB14 TaxID=1447944 RepID=A0A6A4HLT3_9AGAR|nr:DnaJ-domain-containing protein [Gymnopus androsaceus JB14]
MSADLYDILHVSRQATAEEIRRAYKKRALQTHPDRNLPQNASASEKDAVEEHNAYEILKDENKRRVILPLILKASKLISPLQAYDIHGVWPPPREEARPTSSYYNDQPRYYQPRSRYRPSHFHDPFFQDPADDFHFTDPFVFFDSHLLVSPILAWAWHGMGSTPMNNHRRAFSTSMSMSSRGGGRWASESTMSQTVNGVTHTVKKRRDWDGNEYVTRTYPDGRKVLTINGVVSESDQGNNIPPPPRNNYLTSGSPPPPYSPRNYAEPERPVIPVPNFSGSANYIDEDVSNHSKSSRKRWWGRS